MEKNVFQDRQPMVLYGGKKALVLLNEKAVTERIGGMDSSGDEGMTEERTAYQYDGYWLDGVDSENDEAVLAAAKKKVIADITAYDSSTAVNAFVLNGKSVWLDKATRVGLMNSTTIAQNMGKKTTTLWLGDVEIEVDCGKAIQLLSALEMYALECFNVTAAHKKAVSGMESIKDVLEYDYSQGYPDKLKMEV